MRLQPIVLHGVKTAWFSLVALHQPFVNLYPIKVPMINPQRLTYALRHVSTSPCILYCWYESTVGFSYGHAFPPKFSLPSNTMQHLSHRGIISIAVVWTFTASCLISVISYITWVILSKRFHKADLMIVVALIIGILVSGQITWATVREGSRQHQSQFTLHALDIIAKVRAFIQYWLYWSDVASSPY